MQFGYSLLILTAAVILSVCSGVRLEDNPNYVVAVLAATSPTPFRLQAWLHSDLGLVLLRPSGQVAAEFANMTYLWPSAFDTLSAASRVVYLGDGAYPAFDDNGDLYFERSTSADGLTVDSREDWVLSFKHRTPKPVASGDEGVPQVVLERRAAKPVVEERKANAPFRITIDPGHGGSDAGAVAQGYQEKAFNLDVSVKLRDLLLADRGLWTIQMTRSTDIDVSLTARTNMANAWPAERFVSIHTNSFTSSTAQGTETYSYAEGGTAAKLRDVIQDEAIKAWGLTNRGSKTENFHVLRETTMPATLSEMGFITSPVDIQKLSNPTSRQQMAAAHMYALRRHFAVLSAEDEE